MTSEKPWAMEIESRRGGGLATKYATLNEARAAADHARAQYNAGATGMAGVTIYRHNTTTGDWDPYETVILGAVDAGHTPMSSDNATLADRIRVELATPYWRDCIQATRPAKVVSDLVTAVLDLHVPQRLYDACGHDHTDGEPGVVLIDEHGYVCADGYQFSVCRECCCDPDGNRGLTCADTHGDVDAAPCWPCPTVRGVARALGLRGSW